MRITIFNAEALGDRLSPILIKEFRQGLRSHLFTWAFMLIHLFMVGALVFSLSVGSSARHRMEASLMYWLMVAAPLLLILPFGAMGSVSQERKDGTLDLLQLAHQNTFRLILGKWMANAALTLLLVMAIMPYMVLRYYLGGMDIFSDLQDLFFILIGSGLLTCIAILCSSYDIHPMRQWIAFLVLGFWLLMALGGVIVAMHEFAQHRVGATDFQGFGFYIFYVSFCLLYFVLKWATIQVAPCSEYHGLAMRWFYILFMLINISISWLSNSKGLQGATIFVSVIISIFMVFRCFTELPAEYSGQLTSFRRKGFLHSLHLFFMAPGWATAFFYGFVMMGLFILNFMAIDDIMSKMSSHAQEYATLFCSILLAILTPFVVGHLLPFGPKSPLLRAVIAMAIFLLPYLLYALGHQLDEPWAHLFLILSQCTPVASAFLCAEVGFKTSILTPVLIWISHALMWLGLAWLSLTSIGKTFALRRDTMVSR